MSWFKKSKKSNQVPKKIYISNITNKGFPEEFRSKWTAQDIDNIRKIVSYLPEKEKQIVQLYIFNGLKSQQVAEILGINRNQVYNSLHHILRKIKQMITGINYYDTDYKDIAINEYFDPHQDLVDTINEIEQDIEEKKKTILTPPREEIKQQKQDKLSKLVEYAEQLAQSNGGKLPNRNKLLSDPQMLELIRAIRYYPEKFSHIPREIIPTQSREQKQDKLSKLVEYAEQLAASNGGKLPSRDKLIMNPKMIELRRSLSSPRFSHIPREE